ncbi:MAG: UDPGP type 1 family protein [bacterium]|nr:UDPGP type 1 family protein [bacterium]
MIKVEDEVLQKQINLLYEYKQEHVLKWWDQLSIEEGKEFSDQICSINIPLVGELAKKHVIDYEQIIKKKELAPPEVISIPKEEKDIEKEGEAKKFGEIALKNGEVGCFLVAGGQSTRLGLNSPKGTYPIGPITKRSLYQIHVEKIKALSEKYDIRIPLYIMTSKYTHEGTIKYFETNQFFGLPSQDIRFIQQGMVPAVDRQGNMILDKKNHIFENPNGHGGTILAIRDSNALNDMKQRGIKYLFYFQVDNALLKIADPVFIGYHFLNKSQMSAKVVAKKHPEEKIGLVGYVNGKLGVIEYSELTKEEVYAKNEDGSLKFNAGSPAIHILSVSFIENIIFKGTKLKYHKAFKKIPYISEEGEIITPSEPNGYKFETFIFDLFEEAENVVLMEVNRLEEFSPLKNREGSDSPQEVKKNLTKLYASWIKKANIEVPVDKDGEILGYIETSPLFALDQEDFIQKAEGMSFQRIWR